MYGQPAQIMRYMSVMRERDKNPSNPKTASIALRLTPAEKAALNRQAASRGMALAYYVRARLFRETSAAYEPRIDGQLET